MALTTVKISEMPVANTLDGDEIIPLLQSGLNRRATLDDISTFASSAVDTNAPLFEVRREMVVTRQAGGVSAIGEYGTQSTSVGTADQPLPAGNTTVFAATHRRGAISNAAINSGAAFYDTAAAAFARVSGTARGAGFIAAWRGGMTVARADQKCLIGVIESTGQILNAAEVPSNTTNCLAFGKDQGDANLQIMYNNAAGVCTKVDTGVVFTSLAGLLLEVRITVPAGGASARFQLLNKETGVTLVDTTILATDANYPAADAFLYWHAEVNTGTATGTTVNIYLSRLLMLNPL